MLPTEDGMKDRQERRTAGWIASSGPALGLSHNELYDLSSV